MTAGSVDAGGGRAARRVQGTYYTLTLGNTLAASFIWGINTLFLLDAGLTNLEAGAMGLPVVATSIPGCVDSVRDGVTGTLVAPRDWESLLEAIRAYALDPELRARHGAAGRQRAANEFRPSTVWEGVEKQYHEALNR